MRYLEVSFPVISRATEISNKMSFKSDACIHLYCVACILATIGTTLWCLYNFVLNKDVCLVDYQQYNQNEAFIYPSVSIVIGNPFIEQKLKGYDKSFTAQKYSNFLDGQYWNGDMLHIGYDNVTLDIRNHLLGYEILYGENDTKFVYETPQEIARHGWNLPYVSYRGSKIKSFTIDIPYVRDRYVRSLIIRLDTSIFPMGSRPQQRNYNSSDDDFGSFEVYFHYPGQLFRSFMYGIGKWYWPIRSDDSSASYEMEFHVRGNDVMKLRNKRHLPCHSNEIENDEMVLTSEFRTAGCRPPQTNFTQDLPLCRSKDDMRKAAKISYQKFNKYEPPCQSVFHSHFDYEDIDIDDVLTPTQIRLEVHSLHPTFKYIEHIQALDAQSLIGNSGGYLGLFLGYALIQLPNAVAVLARKITKHFCESEGHQ